MNVGHLGTPCRRTIARRFCSTPIRTSDTADSEVADGDVSSFLSTLDSFVEQCDSFLPACPQVTSENDAAGVRVEDGEYASGNASCSRECFTEYCEGQSLPVRASTAPQGNYVEDDRIGPFGDADDVLALSREDECMEDTLLEQYSSSSQNSTCSSTRACKGSIEDANETLALSSEDECTESTRFKQYASVSQHSVCTLTRVQCSEQGCGLGQGSEHNDEHVCRQHDANFVILNELNCEDSLSLSPDAHTHLFDQECLLVSENYSAKTTEHHYRQQYKSFHGSCVKLVNFASETYQQEPKAGELSHQTCTRTESAYESRMYSEAPQTNKSKQQYDPFNASCRVQNVSVSCSSVCPEKLKEQQYPEYVGSFNESCVMEDASTFKKYEDEPLKAESFDESCFIVDASMFKKYKKEPLEAESFDDSCIMENTSTFKKYDDVEEMIAKEYAQEYNDSGVMNGVSVTRADAGTRERNLACSDSSCHIRQGKDSCVPGGHLAMPCANKLAEQVAQCPTISSPQEVLVPDQKGMYEYKIQCNSAYTLNSSPQPPGSLGICEDTCMGDKPASRVTPHEQRGNLASVEALEDAASEISRNLLRSEAADKASDITPKNCTIGEKPEHCFSIQDLAVSSERVASDVILKQHLEQHASANSPAYFTDVVQSVQDICTTSSLCHEDIVQAVPKFEEADKKPLAPLSAASNDFAGSSSFTEHKLKSNSIESVAESSEKIEIVVLPGPNSNKIDSVAAVDKECKETSLAVSSTSKPVFQLDDGLQSEDICEEIEISDTTLVDEADGAGTDGDTFVREVQSPVASPKSVEDFQLVPLAADKPSMLPLSCTGASGDVLDLDVDTDDTLVGEVQSPVLSVESVKHCQPALKNANSSVPDVPGQPCTDKSECVLPWDSPIFSTDTSSLPLCAPVPPLLVCTSSDDEIYIPEALDMREKLNTIRRGLEQHKPEGLNAHSSSIVPTDFSSEPHSPIVTAPETKNRAPFTSEDPAENMDNENPDWEAVRRLTTDEERYQAVQAVWHNVEIPDPHKELSTFHYRQRTLRLKRAKKNTPSKSKRRKRKASHSSHNDHCSKPAKRQRLDTDIIDLKLKELKRKRERDVTKVQETFNDDIRQLHTSLRTQQETYASHDHDGWSDRHHRRAHTEPWDLRYFLSQEQRICEEFKANAQNIESEYMTREHKLLSAREEVRRVDDFYAGLRDKDPRLLSEKQVKEHFKLEEMLGHFKMVYRTPNE